MKVPVPLYVICPLCRQPNGQAPASVSHLHFEPLVFLLVLLVPPALFSAFPPSLKFLPFLSVLPTLWHVFLLPGFPGLSAPGLEPVAVVALSPMLKATIRHRGWYRHISLGLFRDTPADDGCRCTSVGTKRAKQTPKKSRNAQSSF